MVGWVLDALSEGHYWIEYLWLIVGWDFAFGEGIGGWP